MKHYFLQKLFSARLHFALGLLMLILQRSPVLKMLAYAKHLQFTAPIARILQSIALPATALAAPHAVSGATSSSYTVEYINTPEVKVGTDAVISFENSITPKSWSIQGDIPPGMRITDLRQRKSVENGVIVTGLGLIVGTPTQAGSYDLILTPWSEDDGTGDTAPEPDPGALRLSITVLPNESPPLVSPEIAFSRNEDQVTLSWQVEQAQGFELKASSNLTVWTTVSSNPIVAEGIARITFPITEIANTFYRLEPSN